MSKTVLAVSFFAPPLINAESILVWKTLTELSSHFQVKLLTATLMGNARIDPNMNVPSSVQVARHRTFKPNHALLGKLANKSLGLVIDEEYPWASYSRLPSDKFDVIYSRSHPGASHMLAYRLKQASDKPWIAQFSDPWTQNPYHANHTRLRKRADAEFERRVVERADCLVFPTKEILKMYVSAYETLSLENKSIVLPHHYVPSLYQNTLADDKEISPSKTRTFSYFGDFYGRRSPAPFIHALQQIAISNPQYINQIKVNFYGNIEAKFMHLIEQSPVPVQRGSVTYFESLRLMRTSDVLLLIDAPSQNGVNPFLASKLIDYLGAGKRILGMTDVAGTAANILRTYGHDVVSVHDEAGIQAAIMDCLLSPRVTITPPEEFTTKAVVQRLVQVIQQLT